MHQSYPPSHFLETRGLTWRVFFISSIPLNLSWGCFPWGCFSYSCLSYAYFPYSCFPLFLLPNVVESVGIPAKFNQYVGARGQHGVIVLTGKLYHLIE